MTLSLCRTVGKIKLVLVSEFWMVFEKRKLKMKEEREAKKREREEKEINFNDHA